MNSQLFAQENTISCTDWCSITTSWWSLKIHKDRHWDRPLLSPVYIDGIAGSVSHANDSGIKSSRPSVTTLSCKSLRILPSYAPWTQCWWHTHPS